MELDFSSTNAEDGSQKSSKIPKIISKWSFGVIVTAVIFFAFVLGMHLRNQDDELHRNPPTACNRIKDELKFDCFPREKVNENLCTLRRCCWSLASENEKVPSCFFSRNFTSYEVLNVSKLEGEIDVLLNNTKKSGYPKDVKFLQLMVIFETKSRVRVKIVDSENARFEPPYPKITITSNFRGDTDYDILIDEKSFGFAVVRKETGTVIFDTRNTPGFVYSDQFIQLSALIPSKFIYGLGEHRNNFILDTNWEEITLFNRASNSEDHANLYGSHPFYLAIEERSTATNKTASHGVFLLNSNAMDIILQPAPAITYRTVGGILDFYFFLGPSPADVTSQYAELIGFPFLPPYWSLGFHLSRFGLHDINELKTLWKRNKIAGIPFDTQWSDVDYMDGRNDFTVNPTYTGLKDFVDELHEEGMKYVVILDAGIASQLPRGSYPPYDEGLQNDIFIKNSTGQLLEGVVWNEPRGTVFPDFTNPHIQSYWLNLTSRLHDQISFDGLWLNLNEIENFVNGSIQGCPTNNTFDYPPYVPGVVGDHLFYRTLCMSAKHYAGSHYNFHNIHALMSSDVTNACLSTIRAKRPFVLSRSTFAGSGRYTAHWTGDIASTWDDMKHSIGDIMSFNLFGIPMVGADICGFHGNATQLLCQRWHQLGAFYPFARNHNVDDVIDQDPSQLGPDAVTESTKKAFTIRYKLLPYLYTLFYKAHTKGDTVVRPLFFEFSDDLSTYAQNTQFLWGPAFLVVPVLEENATSVVSYFPNGTWYSLYTMKARRSSGEYITLSAPIDKIPLFIRAKYIIPFQEPSLTTEKSRKNPFGLYVALDDTNTAAGMLFWDDGDSLETVKRGDYNLINYECDGSTLSGNLTNRGYNTKMILNTIHVLGISSKINTVIVNNRPHTDFTTFFTDKRLEIRNAQINMLSPFDVKWT